MVLDFFLTLKINVLRPNDFLKSFLRNECNVHNWNKSFIFLSTIDDVAHHQESDNLQYNMLARWVDGTNNSLTKRRMFQALFIFIFLKL